MKRQGRSPLASAQNIWLVPILRLCAHDATQLGVSVPGWVCSGASWGPLHCLLWAFLLSRLDLGFLSFVAGRWPLTPSPARGARPRVPLACLLAP